MEEVGILEIKKKIFRKKDVDKECFRDSSLKEKYFEKNY